MDYFSPRLGEKVYSPLTNHDSRISAYSGLMPATFTSFASRS